MMPQVRQGPLNTAIPPGSILLRHADHELLDILGHAWPVRVFALPTSIELLRDETVGPTQEGVGRGDGRDLFELFPPERMGERGKAPTCRVGQAQPVTPELGFQDAVFRQEIGDNLLLVLLQPASDHGNEDWEEHSYSSG